MECQLDRINIHYEVFGEGFPMVLLHGAWTDHRQIAGSTEPNFAERSGWKRIYPDLPGMGKTTGYEWITDSDGILEVMCDFIDAVVGDEPFVVGGWSYGAYVARGILQRKFDQVEGFVMECPLILADMAARTKPPQAILVSDTELRSQLTPEEREEFEKFGAVQNPEIWERTRAEVFAGGGLVDGPHLTRLQAEGYAFSFDVDALDEPFQKPSLILVGRQDWVVGYQDAWKLIERYPRATFAVLDRAGHNLPIEQEQLAKALIAEWLDRVEESLKS